MHKNTNALYECDCFTGVKESPEGTCDDVDECQEDTHNCIDYTNCIKTSGDFDCECINGFTCDGSQCKFSIASTFRTA